MVFLRLTRIDGTAPDTEILINPDQITAIEQGPALRPGGFGSRITAAGSHFYVKENLEELTVLMCYPNLAAASVRKEFA